VALVLALAEMAAGVELSEYKIFLFPTKELTKSFQLWREKLNGEWKWPSV